MLALNFESNPKGTNLTISLTDLGIRLGDYSDIKRHGIPFLSPCNVKLEMTQKSGVKLGYYKLIMDSIYFKMTPTLYDVVMGVINAIMKSGTEKTKIESENKRRLEDAEPMIIRQIDESSLKLFDKANPVKGEAEVDELYVQPKPQENEIEPQQQNELLESLDLLIKECYITFCEESYIELQPLAVVKIRMDGRIANWTRNIHVKAGLTLEASYYNDRFSNWEPLIENLMINEDEYRPWGLDFWYAMEPGRILQPPVNGNKMMDELNFPVKDLDYSSLYEIYYNQQNREQLPVQFGLQDEEIILHEDRLSVIMDDLKISETNLSIPTKESVGTASYVLVESRDMLNLNVTPSAYKVIMYLTQITAGSVKKEVVETKSKPALKFSNFLGESCKISVSNNSFIKPDNAFGYGIEFEFNVSKMKKLELMQNPNASISSSNSDKSSTDQNNVNSVNEKIRILMVSSQCPQIDAFYDDSYKFNVMIYCYEKCVLSLKTDGSYLMPLKEIKIQNGKYGLL